MELFLRRYAMWSWDNAENWRRTIWLEFRISCLGPSSVCWENGQRLLCPNDQKERRFESESKMGTWFSRLSSVTGTYYLAFVLVVFSFLLLISTTCDLACRPQDSFIANESSSKTRADNQRVTRNRDWTISSFEQQWHDHQWSETSAGWVEESSFVLE